MSAATSAVAKVCVHTVVCGHGSIRVVVTLVGGEMTNANALAALCAEEVGMDMEH